MSAYTNTAAALQRADAILDRYFTSTAPTKTWAQLAEVLLPEPPLGSPLAELDQYKSWVRYTSMIARGRLEKRLGHRHPELSTAWQALDDRAFRVTAPITFASRNASASSIASENAARLAAEAAAKAANAPNADVTRRFPISGAKPFHAGSRPAINLPADPIPYAWRDRAMRLVGKLFSITRDRRRQGVMKQSGMTVIKTLMLNFANGKTGECFPSYITIAARCGLGRSTVADAIAVLSDLGFLQVTNRTRLAPIMGRNNAVIGHRPVQTSNSYTLGAGNWLAIAAAAPKGALDAVADWLEEWQRFLIDLKNFLLKGTESNFRPVTDKDIKSYRNDPSQPNRKAPLLRRLCKLRPNMKPKTFFANLT